MAKDPKLSKSNALPLIMAGLGGISRQWLAALADNPDWELVAACDPDPAARRRMVESGRLPAERVYCRIDPALDVAPGAPVLMLIPPDRRLETGRLCLLRGHPLLSEKPMSVFPQHALTLAETARRTGVPYAVNQNYRFCVFARTVRELIAGQAVGPIAFAECSTHKFFPARGYRAEIADVMVFEMGVHYVDLLRYWFDCELAAVQAVAPTIAFNSHNSEPVFQALFEMAAGPTVAVTASRESRGQADGFEGRWRFCGPDGSIHINDFGQGLGVYLDRQADQRPELIVKSRGIEEGFRAQLDDFCASLRQGRPAETNCFDNLRTIAGCYAIGHAYRSGLRTTPAQMLPAAFI